MYEYHGWAVLREAPSDVDEDRLDEIVQEVRERVTRLGKHNPFAHTHTVNGAYHVVVTGFANHFSSEAQDVLDLFRFIAHAAPGSYGLLYIWDDEDTSGRDNEFQAWVLRRGTFEWHRDTLLSPCVPSIEDG